MPIFQDGTGLSYMENFHAYLRVIMRNTRVYGQFGIGTATPYLTQTIDNGFKQQTYKPNKCMELQI